MTDVPSGQPRKPWHDLAHTASMLMARALARHERTTADRRGFTPAFTFELMAAATTAEPPLPHALEAREDGLAMTIEERGPELWLTLQLAGFAALDEYGGRPGRLVSHNGAIDYPFAFDAHGRAVCVLANEPAVRHGIAGLAVTCDDEPVL